MNNTKLYTPGSIICREGEPGDCMYEVESGKVGVYHDYGGPDEKLIAELYSNNVFGEMGLLDHAPRSATVVALEDNTTVMTVTEEDFHAYFEENPVEVLEIVKQMCHNLRKTTNSYIEACHTVYDTVEVKKSGSGKSKSLFDRISKLCEFYSRVSTQQRF